MGHPIRIGRRCRGFTFVELMVVITIIVILISMAIPVYQKSIIRAKESVLKNNLFTMRTVIDNYTYDKQKAPQTLQDLVSSGYIKSLPKDPFTNSIDWGMRSTKDDPTSNSWGGQNVFDIYTKTTEKAPDGSNYSDW